MTDVVTGAGRVRLADPREAAGLAAYLARLLRYDKSAAVRLQSAGSALAVFGRPPLGERAPIAVRTARLDLTAGQLDLDATLSAGQLLDALESAVRGGEAEFVLPPTVTGPAWAGLLPPRGGWTRAGELPAAEVAAAVTGGVEEFRARTEGVAGADADAVADEIWSRPLTLPSAPDGVAGLPLRAAHAAQVLGFLVRAESVSVHEHPAWVRLNGPFGSVAVRKAPSPGAGLGLTPVR